MLRPDDACQKRFSWFFNWIPKVQKRVNLVDLAKSCPNFDFSVSLRIPFLNILFELDSYSNEDLLATFGFDTAENEPCKVCPISAYRFPRSFGGHALRNGREEGNECFPYRSHRFRGGRDRAAELCRP